MNSMTSTTDSSTPTPPRSCPDWCNKGGSHEYDSQTGEGDSLTFYRYHSSVPEWDYEARVRVHASESNRGGRLRTEQPTIAILDDDLDSLSAADARILARELLQAAELLDELLVDRG